MAVTLRVPTILRSLTGGASEVSVDGAATLAELIEKVDAEHPGIRGAGGLETPTPDGVTVSIIPAVAGG